MSHSRRRDPSDLGSKFVSIRRSLSPMIVLTVVEPVLEKL